MPRGRPPIYTVREDGTKLCRSCREHKPTRSFRSQPSQYYGYSYDCLDCKPYSYGKRLHRDDDGRQCNRCLNYLPWSKFYGHDNDHATMTTCRDCVREAILIKKYGISLSEYDAMLHKQSGLCAICFSPPPAGYPLCVDHDHATGAVRSLLCSECNLGLGNFRDTPAFLREAARYLEFHQNETKK